jgi:hypothetical protein
MSAALLSLVTAACAAESTEPHQLQPAATDPNFVLFVTNHSAARDKVDIDVVIDADLAVEGEFPKGTEYKFDFELVLGGHAVTSISDSAGTQRIDQFVLRGGVQYGVLEFWDQSPQSGGPAGPVFTFELSDSPPAFEGSAEGSKE